MKNISLRRRRNELNIAAFADAHIVPGENLERFSWLSRFILDRKPETVIQLGDFTSFDSLSHWDQNKRLRMEGRRYQADIDASGAALRLLFGPIQAHNLHRRVNKLKQYKPRILWFEGNHENRVTRYVEQYPELEGQLDIRRQLGLDTIPNLEYVKYPEYRVIEGITVMHAPRNAVGPISSQYIGDKVFNFYRNHILYGHTHRKTSTSRRMFEEATPRFSINAGCFLAETPEYMEGNVENWWKGLLMLTVEPGVLDVEEISLERLRRLYD